MFRRPTWFAGFLALLMVPAWLRADEAAPASAGTEPGKDMMSRYLVALVDQAAKKWEAQYEQRKTPEQIAEYQKQSREKLVAALGGWPDRSPLDARVVGRIERDGYTVEKVIFESQPHFLVTALLFLPDAAKFKPPYPGVVEPCGHSSNGKAYKSYQTFGCCWPSTGWPRWRSIPWIKASACKPGGNMPTMRPTKERWPSRTCTDTR